MTSIVCSVQLVSVDMHEANVVHIIIDYTGPKCTWNGFCVYFVFVSNGAHATYHECETLLLNNNNNHDPHDEFDHAKPELDPIQALVNK
jgi:hypothetical protein